MFQSYGSVAECYCGSEITGQPVSASQCSLWCNKAQCGGSGSRWSVFKSKCVLIDTADGFSSFKHGCFLNLLKLCLEMQCFSLTCQNMTNKSTENMKYVILNILHVT